MGDPMVLAPDGDREVHREDYVQSVVQPHQQDGEQARVADQPHEELDHIHPADAGVVSVPEHGAHHQDDGVAADRQIAAAELADRQAHFECSQDDLARIDLVPGLRARGHLLADGQRVRERGHGNRDRAHQHQRRVDGEKPSQQGHPAGSEQRRSGKCSKI